MGELSEINQPLLPIGMKTPISVFWEEMVEGVEAASNSSEGVVPLPFVSVLRRLLGGCSDMVGIGNGN